MSLAGVRVVQRRVKSVAKGVCGAADDGRGVYNYAPAPAVVVAAADARKNRSASVAWSSLDVTADPDSCCWMLVWVCGSVSKRIRQHTSSLPPWQPQWHYNVGLDSMPFAAQLPLDADVDGAGSQDGDADDDAAGDCSVWLAYFAPYTCTRNYSCCPYKCPIGAYPHRAVHR